MELPGRDLRVEALKRGLVKIVLRGICFVFIGNGQLQVIHVLFAVAVIVAHNRVANFFEILCSLGGQCSLADDHKPTSGSLLENSCTVATMIKTAINPNMRICHL